jgi:hypothetical protein
MKRVYLWPFVVKNSFNREQKDAPVGFICFMQLDYLCQNS